jgi:HSP20 family protein
LLVTTGEKTRETEEKNEKVYRMERAWGAFARTIPLPGPVDTEKTTAAFKDGVLTVTLPKTMAAKGNFIPVKAG